MSYYNFTEGEVVYNGATEGYHRVTRHGLTSNSIRPLTPEEIPGWARDKKQIENLEGWNKEMYENHKAEISKLEEKCKEYAYIGERIAAQDGNWLMLHAGALEWLVMEFDRLKSDEAKKVCTHEKCDPGREYVMCLSCGKIRTGQHKDAWGVAAGKWFKNLAEAQFYKKHGRYPE